MAIAGRDVVLGSIPRPPHVPAHQKRRRESSTVAGGSNDPTDGRLRP